MNVDEPVYLNNVDADECIELVMVLFYLHDEVKFFHILAEADEEGGRKGGCNKRGERGRRGIGEGGG